MNKSKERITDACRKMRSLTEQSIPYVRSAPVLSRATPEERARVLFDNALLTLPMLEPISPLRGHIETLLGCYLVLARVARLVGERRDEDAWELLVGEEWDAIRDLLRQKNAAYGNSALDPVRFLSRSAREEGIRIRADDKLSRIARGSAAGEDAELDLLGYLVLLHVAKELARESGEPKRAAETLHDETGDACREHAMPRAPARDLAPDPEGRDG